VELCFFLRGRVLAKVEWPGRRWETLTKAPSKKEIEDESCKVLVGSCEL